MSEQNLNLLLLGAKTNLLKFRQSSSSGRRISHLDLAGKFALKAGNLSGAQADEVVAIKTQISATYLKEVRRSVEGFHWARTTEERRAILRNARIAVRKARVFGADQQQILIAESAIAETRDKPPLKFGARPTPGH